MVAPNRREYQRTADGRYRAQPRDPLTGRRLSITADTLPELHARLQKLREVRRDLRHQQIDPREARRILRPVEGKLLTVCEVWERYFKGVPESSKAIARSSWKHKLLPYFGKAMAWELDKTRMREWQAALEKKSAASNTIENAFYYLHGAMRLAVHDRQLDAMPWGDYRPPSGKVKRERGAAGNVTELGNLIACAFGLDERDWKARQYADRHVVIGVAGLAGLRQAEVCALGWDHVYIDGPDARLHIEWQGKRRWWERFSDRPRDPTKGRRAEWIAINQDAVTLLRAQRERLKERGWYRIDGPVFPGKTGGWRRGAVAMKPPAVRELARAAGITNWDTWVFHSMRHSFSTLETNASGDIRATMQRTRHTSVKQLMGYVHPLTRGLPAPAMPPLALPPIDTTGEPTTELTPFANLLNVTAERAAAIETERAEERRRERAESELPFDEVAAKYVALGWSLKRLIGDPPREVAAALKRAYMRGYAKERRAKKGDAVAWRAAGFRARRATAGAWAKVARRVYGAANATGGAPAEPDPWGLSGSDGSTENPPPAT